ncbi:MAG: PSD1 and planctomycete cytochrome C domain-containing protein [Bryobacteraceae bacterium]|nr:PSD1 and planctomycete cytochrome C domain-containing protein [Bryobacteraceae bacterium]
MLAIFVLLAAAPDFVKDVRPILSDRCFACHGPDDNRRMANVRLDTKEGIAQALAKIEPRVAHDKKALRMPPPGSPELTPAQIATLKNWIASGGEWRSHWSFDPPQRAVPPNVPGATPIDKFIRARLDREKLVPAPRADRATLLRRASLDLTGLPPTPAELSAYLADSSPRAYEKAIDRLLASPHYGERMALHWLDLARYADTHGYHIDSHRDMWAWRDWVIGAFNKNLPYDKFTVWQLAGDLLPNPTPEQILATGFNRNHMINYEGGAIPEEYLVEYVVDRVEATSNVWMGLTMGCARCHDHKYDPIRQRDFYRFFAFFNTVREKGLDGQKGNAEPLLRLPEPAQKARLDAVATRIAELEDWQDRANIPALQRDWEAQAKFPAAPESSPEGKLAASIRVKIGARLDTVPTTIFEEPVRVWIDGGEAIGRNRRGSYLYVARDGRVERTRKQFVTGEWMNVAVSGGALYIDGERAETQPISGVVIPAVHTRGSREDPRQFARSLTLDEIRVLARHEPARLALAVPESKRSKDQRQTLFEYFSAHAGPESVRQVHAELAALYREREDLLYEIPSAMVMGEMAIPRETKILARGDYRNGTEAVSAQTPGFLPPLPKDAPPNRLGLAQWLVSREHPLTARVAVNRFWHMLFGTGLVKTVEDFGSQGEVPVHPELLDWLAVEFMESGWDVKRIVKLMAMSDAYQRSSKATPALVERDPDNRLLVRGPRFRLPAEFVRDNALAAAGLLNAKIGGPSVAPYQPSGVWEDIAYGDTFSAQRYQQDHGDKLYRRSMYTFWKRTAPPPGLATFDAPDREKCIARRALTNTPLQALVLLNDPTYVEAARVLAANAMATPDPLQAMYRRTLARNPTPRESQLLRAQFVKQLSVYRNWKAGADELLSVGEAPVPAKIDRAALAAWTTVASTILNLDETVTKQ